nr:ribonuclease H-like domain-containing protein [Tanacetum cinerariifolium]
MKIALTGKNKFGFAYGTYVKHVTSLVLSQQWERCNAIVLCWVLSSLPPELYLGHVYSQIDSEVWDELEETYDKMDGDPLPDVEEAFNVVYREESHRGLHPGTGKSHNSSGNRGLNPNLLCKNWGNSFGNSNGKVLNNNTKASKGASSSYGSTSFDTQFTKDQMIKILSLINDKPSGNASANMAGIRPTFFNGDILFNLQFEKYFCAQTSSYMYNLTLGWILDSRANQHLINSTKNVFNVSDISSLNLTMGHPNGTLAKNTAIGSLRLTANVVLFDVLVIPKYNVSLMSAHKLIKDSKLFLRLDETKCYIQDLNLVKTLGTDSEAAGLYLFDVEECGKFVVGRVNSTCVCHASKQL